MTKQIAVRLPDDLVAFVDEMIAEGRATSRATVVHHALERERRREIAARDADILAKVGEDSDMDVLAQHVVDMPLDLD